MMLIEAQKLVVPSKVRHLLGFSLIPWLRPSVPIYKLSKKLELEGLVKDLLLPSDYKSQIQALDIN